MGFGKAKSLPKWQEKPQPKTQMFRLSFKQPEWKSPMLREIAKQVERRLKPHLSLAYHARNRN